MCNLFHACLYLEEDILNQIVKEAGFFSSFLFLFFTFFMSEVTDIPLLIRNYCIKNKLKKRQESNWPLSRLYS